MENLGTFTCLKATVSLVQEEAGFTVSTLLPDATVTRVQYHTMADGIKAFLSVVAGYCAGSCVHTMH